MGNKHGNIKKKLNKKENISKKTELKQNQISILAHIKSSYIIKEVFSFLNEELKLNIIINNKHLQNKLGINIEDYKKVSGRYIIGEKNGIGKEYKLGTNKLIFEGEYLNWKKNGIGKEYDEDNGALIFEGEYYNGKRKGKGKEYDKYGKLKLKFEGEYLFGKRNGNGKEYDYDCNLEFEYRIFKWRKV